MTRETQMTSPFPFGARLNYGLKAALFACMAAMISSCGTMHPDSSTTTGSIPDDYRTKHPITLAEVEHDLDIPVATNDRGMTPANRDVVRGFIQDYASLSTGTMQIAVPEGAPNSAATPAASREIQKLLTENGVARSKIVLTSYVPKDRNASAPVRMTFVAVTALTGECGQWPTDLFGPTVIDNTNWENFGCASQQNLAAQIANPSDLVGPRGMSPIDAEERAQVISVYRQGS
jgi:pilus assembly protein CpaD